MESLWPWVVIAGSGVLHGLNPVTVWACGGCGGPGEGLPWRLAGLLPVAMGHLCAVLLVAAAVPLALRMGREFDPLVPQAVAAAALLLVVGRRFRAGRCVAVAARGRAGLGLWAFIVGTAHGTGWMLVPVFVPLCGSSVVAGDITASRSVLLASAAVGVHLVAMLAATAVAAAAASALRRGGLRWLVAPCRS